MSTVKHVEHSGTLHGTLTMELPAGLSRVLGIASFVALLAVGAHVKVFLPGSPVPVTLQTLFVLLAGAMLGTRDGLTAVTSYIALGVAGIPLFATNFVGGLTYLLGPTGGYLLGFLVATWFAGRFVNRSQSFLRVAGTLAIADVLLLALGTAYLSLFMGMGLTKAILIGLLPFVPGEILKVGAAAGISSSFRRGES